MTRRISVAAASRLALAALLYAGVDAARAAGAPEEPRVDLAAEDLSGLDADASLAGAAVAMPAPAPAFSSFAAPLPASPVTAKQKRQAQTDTRQTQLASAPQPSVFVAIATAAPVTETPLPREPLLNIATLTPVPMAAPALSPTPPIVLEPAPVAAPLAPQLASATPGPSAATAPMTTLDARSRVAEEEGPGVTPPATATPAGEVESLRDAIIAALKGNPDIQIALAQQDDAHGAIGEARAGYMPHLDVTVGYGPEIARPNRTVGTTRRDRLEGTITLSQNLWDWGVTINDIKRARASYRAAQWATREQIEAISFDITNAYLGMLQQQKLIDLTNGEIAATKKIQRMVAVQKELGLTTQADVDRAKARVENIQSTLLDRQSSLQQARDAYKRLTNHIPGIAVDLPNTIASLPGTVDDAVEMIDAHSPRMAQAVEDRRSLDRQYASQTGTFLPRFGVMVQGNHKYDVMGATGLAEDARAMVTMSYSFFNGGADIATRNRIGARLRQADYELDRRRREVEQDIRADFQSLGAAQQKIATINAEIAAAQNVADLYKQQFREGKRSVFDMLDSQQVLFAARSNAVGNEIAMHLAEYRVLQKLGGLFDLVSAGEPLPPLVVRAPVKPAKD